MSFVINTNVNSLLAQNYLSNNTAGLSQAMQRLSSGMRINSAMDDPAGLAVGTKMGVTTSALYRGAANANDGLSLAQTADSAINNISNILSSMNTLASQAANGVYSATQLTDLNATFTALRDEINRVASSTQFNGINLLDGSAASVTIQVGSGNTVNDRLTVSLSDLTTATLGISADVITSVAAAQTALTNISTAISTVTSSLATLGANEKNLDAAINNNNGIAASLSSAKSRIMDTDYAAESSNQAKFNILTQSNIAMLAQANSTPQMVMQLLKG